ncbi:MAG: sulfotransferase family protein [Myxococcota bacterium]
MAIAGFTPYPVLRRLIRRYGVDERYRKRARARLLTSALAEPLRGWERLRYGRRLARTEIAPEPVFLLGYGRSGTTHLHNLLWQDPQFGVVSNYQTTVQSFALTGRGWLERALAKRMPAKRPMDNVAISVDAPQEEEIALVNSTEYAPLHFMSFPRALPGAYDPYVCDLGDDPARLEGFRRAYVRVLRKATILADGRRLALKTPTNTARIPFLLETFPDAKFVHIIRNPYLVYQSMRNMWRVVIPRETLQEFGWEELDAWTADAYVRVMRRYLEDRKRIPEGRLFELRFEDLDQRPLEVLPQLYAELDLGGWEQARPGIERYLEGLGRFEKNRFEFPSDVVEVVNREWGFALDAFGYERIAPGEVPR